MKRPARSRPIGSRTSLARRLAVPVVAVSAVALMTISQPASAGIVPTVDLLTAASYSVLAGSTITNTGPSILDKSAGLSPGSAIVGFPPGTVLAPGTIELANAVALQAKNDLTTAYLDAAGRPIEFTQTNGDLVGLTLAPGVYEATAQGPLSLSGQLTLDGQNNPLAVFIFQTDSTLITASASSIILINGASECNVFWQVGSSATLGAASTFVGNVLALTSITAQAGATIQGRLLAQTGAVTLANNVFTSTSCAFGPAPPATTTTTTAATATTVAAPVATVPAPTVATVPAFTDITLPNTGRRSVGSTTAIGTVTLALGAAALVLARRRRPAV